MTLVTNIKGYINGNEWGVHGPDLITYDEITTYIGTGNTGLDELISILNIYPIDYFNKLNSESHIDSDSYFTQGLYGIYATPGTYYPLGFGSYNFAYDTSNDTYVCYNNGIRSLIGNFEPL